jgi:glycosyltransferase involved in cell wall biosynthesis
MALISLIHPSRGRAEKSNLNARNWFRNKGSVEVELILSLDSDDYSPYGSMYFQETPECNMLYHHFESHVKIIYNHNKSVVEATNNAAKIAKGDILIYLSDDFDCPENWGLSVLKEFEGEDRPLLLKVDDCLQKFDVPVLTIPIMNRALYERLGYFWHSDYKSMFCDEDLYWTTRKLGAMKYAPHLKFEHQHVSVGKAPDDDTYRNSAKNWDQGKAVFAKRKVLGFPI